MPNTASAKKMARKIAARTEVNKTRRTRMRSFVRKVEEAIASGSREAAEAALKAAEPIIVRAAQKGIIHSRTAARKVSRLSARVKAVGA
ncbi:MAG: 30S ribosomal protein S20 [Flavobacteriaceae bacterium]